jgi:hypothetical protein
MGYGWECPDCKYSFGANVGVGFLYNKSEHQVSRETGVPQRTIHDRKIKILAKLKRLMNE